MPIRSLFLLPVELILPILGVLLIRTKSPIRALIYRSFLGSIAALLYAVCGAPDVALTEVLVGTLLSSILYIITIRACYSIVIIVPNEVNIPQELINNLKSMFNELKMNVVFEPSNLSNSKEDYQILFSSKTLAGSPHAILDGQELCIESPILLEELLETSFYKQNQFIKLFCSQNISTNVSIEEIK